MESSMSLELIKTIKPFLVFIDVHTIVFSLNFIVS